jgi:hypothetical protein
MEMLIGRIKARIRLRAGTLNVKGDGFCCQRFIPPTIGLQTQVETIWDNGLNRSQKKQVAEVQYHPQPSRSSTTPRVHSSACSRRTSCRSRATSTPTCAPPSPRSASPRSRRERRGGNQPPRACCIPVDGHGRACPGPTPIMMARPCPVDRGRRDKPGDDDR